MQIMEWRAFPTEDTQKRTIIYKVYQMIIYKVYQMMVDFRKEHASAYNAIRTPRFNTGCERKT